MLTRESDAAKTVRRIVDLLSRPGTSLEFCLVTDHTAEGFWEDYDSVSETGIRDAEDVAIFRVARLY